LAFPPTPNSIQQAVKGAPLLSLGCFNYDTTMGVAVRPESPIKEPADLKGKKLGSTLTSGEYPVPAEFLKKVGLTMDDIQSIALDNKVREVGADREAVRRDHLLRRQRAAEARRSRHQSARLPLQQVRHAVLRALAHHHAGLLRKEKALCEAMPMGLARA
jgi:hypothetical protein